MRKPPPTSKVMTSAPPQNFLKMANFELCCSKTSTITFLEYQKKIDMIFQKKEN